MFKFTHVYRCQYFTSWENLTKKGPCFTPKSKRTKTFHFAFFRIIRLYCIIFVTIKYIFTLQNPYILTSTSFRKSLENTYLQNKLFCFFISQTCSWQVLWRSPSCICTPEDANMFSSDKHRRAQHLKMPLLKHCVSHSYSCLYICQTGIG